MVTPGGERPLTFAARVDGDEVVVEASCPCGAAVRQAIAGSELHGDDRGRWGDADANAARLRAVAYALEAAGCSHAYHDPRVVTPCLFRPARPRAGEMREWRDELGAVGVAEAWEALASRGAIPMDWIDDDARRFAGEGGALGAWPGELATALAVAADVAGVRSAEALARELVWRTREHGLAQPRRVAWRAVDPAFWRPGRGWFLAEGTAVALGATRPVATVPPWWDLARFDVDGADAWRALGVAAPNPFEPLAALWLLGYAVDRVDDEAVVIATPAL